MYQEQASVQRLFSNYHSFEEPYNYVFTAGEWLFYIDFEYLRFYHYPAYDGEDPMRTVSRRNVVIPKVELKTIGINHTAGDTSLGLVLFTANSGWMKGQLITNHSDSNVSIDVFDMPCWDGLNATVLTFDKQGDMLYALVETEDSYVLMASDVQGSVCSEGLWEGDLEPEILAIQIEPVTKSLYYATRHYVHEVNYVAGWWKEWYNFWRDRYDTLIQNTDSTEQYIYGNSRNWSVATFWLLPTTTTTTTTTTGTTTTTTTSTATSTTTSTETQTTTTNTITSSTTSTSTTTSTSSSTSSATTSTTSSTSSTTSTTSATTSTSTTSTSSVTTTTSTSFTSSTTSTTSTTETRSSTTTSTRTRSTTTTSTRTRSTTTTSTTTTSTTSSTTSETFWFTEEVQLETNLLLELSSQDEFMAIYESHQAFRAGFEDAVVQAWLTIGLERYELTSIHAASWSSGTEGFAVDCALTFSINSKEIEDGKTASEQVLGKVVASKQSVLESVNAFIAPHNLEVTSVGFYGVVLHTATSTSSTVTVKTRDVVSGSLSLTVASSLSPDLVLSAAQLAIESLFDLDAADLEITISQERRLSLNILDGFSNSKQHASSSIWGPSNGLSDRATGDSAHLRDLSGGTTDYSIDFSMSVDAESSDEVFEKANATSQDTYTESLVVALISLGEDETAARQAVSISFSRIVRLLGTTTLLTTTTLLMDYIVGWADLVLPTGIPESNMKSAIVSGLVDLFGFSTDDVTTELTQVDETTWTLVFQVAVESGSETSDTLFEEAQNKTTEELRASLLESFAVPALLTNLDEPDLEAALSVTSLLVDRFEPTTTTTPTPPVDHVTGSFEMGLPSHISQENATAVARWALVDLSGTYEDLSIDLQVGDSVGNWTVGFFYHVFSDDAQDLVWALQNATSESLRQLLVEILVQQGGDPDVAEEEVWVGEISLQWFPATATSTTTTTTTTLGPEELELSDFLPFIASALAVLAAVIATLVIGFFLLKNQASVVPVRRSAFMAAIRRGTQNQIDDEVPTAGLVSSAASSHQVVCPETTDVACLSSRV